MTLKSHILFFLCLHTTIYSTRKWISYRKCVCVCVSFCCYPVIHEQILHDEICHNGLHRWGKLIGGQHGDVAQWYERSDELFRDVCIQTSWQRLEITDDKTVLKSKAKNNIQHHLPSVTQGRYLQVQVWVSLPQKSVPAALPCCWRWHGYSGRPAWPGEVCPAWLSDARWESGSWWAQ